MLKILEPDSEKTVLQPIAFLTFAFRPLFLFAAFFSIINLVLWTGVITGKINLNVYGGPLWWHIHEMLFAFAATVVVGFLLTAVQNWSGLRSLNGAKLGGLLLLWLSARIALFFPDQLPHSIIMVLDIAFIPLALIALAIPIVRARLWRNLIFVPILLMMCFTNILMHYSLSINDPSLMASSATFMVLLVTLVMCIMGGRVIPMFTANGTKTDRVNANPILEKLAMSSILAAVFAGSGFIDIPDYLCATLFFLASIIHAIRVFRWRFSVTLKTPLVWSLHISYWCIAIGLMMFALSKGTTLVSHSQAIHSLTVGAMATMILAMISRVSLGHTGRAIIVGDTMKIAFLAIVSAFVVRVFGIYIIDDYLLTLSLSALLWIIAFGLFVIVYTPIMVKPKLQSKS